LLRVAHRSERSIDVRACPSVVGYGVHSSNTITMSAFKSRWTRIEISGLRNTSLPSTGDLK
jgi:hypothetical protein